MSAIGEIRVGTSGWRYPPWRKEFYPAGLVQRRELEYLSRRLNAVEINGSFYSLQRPERYRAWFDETPSDFVFAVKGGRFITHLKQLRDVETALANFYASGVLALGAKLGPFLWQLPPRLAFDPDRVASFFALLPRTTADAASLGARHDTKLKSDPYLEAGPGLAAGSNLKAGPDSATDPDSEAGPGSAAGSNLESGPGRPVRHALEVRHPSFTTPEALALLREHDVALVVADTAGKWPYAEDQTTDFSYVRLHGDVDLYTSGYAESALRRWVAKITDWHDDGRRDVHVYFDNDVKVEAPRNARKLAELLGVAPPSPND